MSNVSYYRLFWPLAARQLNGSYLIRVQFEEGLCLLNGERFACIRGKLVSFSDGLTGLVGGSTRVLCCRECGMGVCGRIGGKKLKKKVEAPGARLINVVLVRYC